MQKNLEKIILSLLKKKHLAREILSQIKRKHAGKRTQRPQWCVRVFNIPTNAQLLKAYHNLLKKNKANKNPELERLLKKREIRTLSGVAPIAVLTKPYPCPGQCIYCPDEKGMPKSYLSNEPAVMRAILNKFDPYRQVQMRLQALQANGHPTDKCELIVMGGTWSCLPHRYQTWFIKRCFQAFNTNSYKLTTNGHKLQIRKIHKIRNSSPFVKNSYPLVLKQNEKAKHRVIGLTLETRPDYITPEEILRMRQLGCTRIELGVQSIYDDILKLNQRGCTRQQIIDATHLLKDAGFKITYHMMPNLPGSTPNRDLQMFKELFTNPDFQPDQLKIYPCVVTKNAEIYQWLNSKRVNPRIYSGGLAKGVNPRIYSGGLAKGVNPRIYSGGLAKRVNPRIYSGDYKPYTQKQLINLLIKIKKIIPPYVRITRLIRDIPSESIIAGNKISNLRQYIQREMKEKGLQCQCIRCREIQGTDYKMSDIKLIKREYSASNGKEIFLSYEDIKQNKIIAFLRLRLLHPQLPVTSSWFPSPKKPQKTINYPSRATSREQLSAINNFAIVRELHTYGTMTPVGQKGKVQHKGFGKKLIAKAEKIARQTGYWKLTVISGIGVRDYYRKMGYWLQDEYMVKDLTEI